MFTKFLRPWRKVAIAAIVSAAGIATASTAIAGECPADKIVADGKGQPMGATAPKDVTDTVLAAIDLSKEKVKADDHQFRMRQLEIQPALGRGARSPSQPSSPPPASPRLPPPSRASAPPTRSSPTARASRWARPRPRT